MVNGKAGEWYQDQHIGGYFNEKGELVVCEEYGLTDADTDKYAVEVQNGDKIPVVILQIMLLDERHMMFELARKQDINI